MATTLVHAVAGGTATDDAGRLHLLIPAHALVADTTVTVASVALPRGVSARMAWRIIVHPGPAVLTRPAELRVALPGGSRSSHSLLVVTDDAASLNTREGSLRPASRSGGNLVCSTWYLPPSAGPPPMRASSLILVVSGASDE